jgi:hypothetical protein
MSAFPPALERMVFLVGFLYHRKYATNTMHHWRTRLKGEEKTRPKTNAERKRVVREYIHNASTLPKLAE